MKTLPSCGLSAWDGDASVDFAAGRSDDGIEIPTEQAGIGGESLVAPFHGVGGKREHHEIVFGKVVISLG